MPWWCCCWADDAVPVLTAAPHTHTENPLLQHEEGEGRPSTPDDDCDKAEAASSQEQEQARAAAAAAAAAAATAAAAAAAADSRAAFARKAHAAAEQLRLDKAAAQRAAEEAAAAAAQPRAHALALSGAWTPEQAAGGYREVDLAPQFRVVPAATGTLEVTLTQSFASPCAALALVPAHPRGARVAGQCDAYSKFTNTSSVLRAPVVAGQAYTLVVAPYEALKAEDTELAWSVTASALLLEPPAPLLRSLREILEADARSARSAERARRSASLAAMQAAARSGGARSTARESWDDFCVAQAEVERLRAQVRASGSGALYRDAWSGTAGAIGSGWAEGQGAVWADLRQMAPHPVLVEDGYGLEDVVQGELGDCYMLSCLADLAAGQGSSSSNGGSGSGGSGAAALDLHAVLDSLFVVGETNPEGVYCVRLWVQRRWVHYFMDGRLPCRANSYIDLTKPKARYACTKALRQAPEHGRYYAPLSVHSSSLNEFWPALLEKAYAMHAGSYAAIEGHATLHSYPLNLFVPHALPGFQESWEEGLGAGAAAALWASLQGWQAKGWPATAGSRSAVRGGGGGGGGSGRDQGIVREHAFSILRVWPGSSAEAAAAEAAGLAPCPRLLRLRNPHGHGEWSGAYSDSDGARWTPALRAALQHSPEASGDDGVFHMEFADFCAQFDSCNVTPVVALRKDGGGWHKREVQGAFTPAQAAQARRAGSDWTARVLAFPQYLLHCAEPSAEFTVLLEVEGRGGGGGRAARAALPAITLSPFAYAGGDGSALARAADASSVPPAQPVLAPLPRTTFRAGLVRAALANAPRGSSLVLVPEVEAQGGSGLQSELPFLLTVLCEHPFSLRWGSSEAGSSTADGVVCVSDS